MLIKELINFSINMHIFFILNILKTKFLKKFMKIPTPNILRLLLNRIKNIDLKGKLEDYFLNIPLYILILISQ